MVATRALLAAGRYERAREELEFILKFQDRKTGMIWHELSQSAGALEWRKYPYMFVHVDLSYDFLDVVAEYYSVTGDLSFVKKNWDALESAYRYCQSLLDPKDGLPRIPGDKQGHNEQDALSDELTLSAGWVAASEAFAALATATGRHAAARAALDASKRARQAVGRKILGRAPALLDQRPHALGRTGHGSRHPANGRGARVVVLCGAAQRRTGSGRIL